MKAEEYEESEGEGKKPGKDMELEIEIHYSMTQLLLRFSCTTIFFKHVLSFFKNKIL